MRLRWAFTCAAVLALAMSACGGGGDGAATAGPSSPTTASGVISAGGVTSATGATAGASGPSSPNGASVPGGPSGGSAASGATGATDRPSFVEPDPDNPACALLTPDVAEPIVGERLGVVGDVAIGSHSTCILRNRGNTISVELRLTEGSDAQREYDTLYASVEGQHGVETIGGLGDQAFRAFAGENAHVLVMDGQTFVRLSTADVGGGLEDETLALARALVAER